MDEWKFARPLTEFNEPFGSASALITHRNAVGGGYVVDDCVYFMCRVEPERGFDAWGEGDMGSGSSGASVGGGGRPADGDRSNNECSIF